MAKMISLNGLPQDIVKSFQANVEPMDVIVGAVAAKSLVPTIDDKLFNPKTGFLKMLTEEKGFLAEKDSEGEVRAWALPVRRLLSAALLGVGLYMAQKGSRRAQGHVVGAIGVEIVDYVGKMVADKLATAWGGLVEFNGYRGYGMLTNDSAYGMLTKDSAYGMLTSDTAYGEPNAYQMAAFAAASQTMTEVEPEAEYA